MSEVTTYSLPLLRKRVRRGREVEAMRPTRAACSIHQRYEPILHEQPPVGVRLCDRIGCYNARRGEG